MFAAMAASRADIPLYVLKHDMPELYHDPLERSGAQFHTLFQLSAAREFFYPVVWPESGGDPDRATRIPPVALDGEPAVRDDAEIVVVPSHYSSLDRVADHLRRQGYDVVNVADDDWEAVPSLLPYIRGADCVVCSGYSTIMDAAVAGTPCVVHPATDEQDAVAEWIDRFDVTGFTIAPEPIDVLDAVATPPEAPEFRNGADVIAQRVLADVRNPDPYATPDSDAGDGATTIDRAARGHSVRAVPTLLAVGLLTVGSAVHPVRVGTGVYSKLHQAGSYLRRGVSRGLQASKRAASYGATQARSGAKRLHAAAKRLGRAAAAPF
ncbi:hypothetical protein [Halosegnis longus]|uniref:hypothetical protein n=1 Tax=Halosegnis longus TaxID=2216012 RepID=UPI00096A7F0C|nr:MULTISPECIES: hypothetical protein [Halobacteriales]